MGLYLSKSIAILLMPPAIAVWAALLGLWLRRSRPVLGAGIVLASLAGLTLLSMPVTGTALLRALEDYPALPAEPDHAGVQAIVVLGSGLYPAAPEYDGDDTVTGVVLERLLYAAQLHRRTGLPLAAAGGSVFGNATPESVAIARCLKRDFGIVPRWVEAHSRNTRENARNVAALLERDGVSRVYLVTHAWHMRRAVDAFRRAGLGVVPAPTVFATRGDMDATFLRFLPSAGGLARSTTAIYEYLGRGWYGMSGE